MLQKLLWLGLAGALGTLSRFALSELTHYIFGRDLPVGTFAVNIAGCFLAGLIWALSEQRFPLGSDVRVILLVGFMGAFTTFSTFMLETGQLVRQTQFIHAFGNIFLHNGIGFVSLFAGLFVGRSV